MRVLRNFEKSSNIAKETFVQLCLKSFFADYIRSVTRDKSATKRLLSTPNDVRAIFYGADPRGCLYIKETRTASFFFTFPSSSPRPILIIHFIFSFGYHYDHKLKPISKNFIEKLKMK